jgi:acetyl esterase/lipase
MSLRVKFGWACVLGLMVGTACAQQPGTPQHLSLWPQHASMALGDTDADEPALDVYLPASNPTQTGIVVCPGGGYKYLAVPGEGAKIAEWLVAHGVAAFVLRYRVAPYKYPVPMMDGERAMRLVRSRAASFGIAQEHIGVMGFSAGGHLASFLMTHFDEKLPEASNRAHDAVDAISARPDFGVLAYAVISMMPGITHAGSHENLIGKTPNAELEAELSDELHVTATSPPAFLVATSDDPIVPVTNSVLFYEAYSKLKLPVEMHLFEHGPHGMNLAEHLPGAAAWPGLLTTWMVRHGWMTEPGATSLSQKELGITAR